MNKRNLVRPRCARWRGQRVAGAFLLSCAGTLALAVTPPASAAEPVAHFCFGHDRPQRASADDIHVFDPYIGRWRSSSGPDDETGGMAHYAIEYQWVDAAQTTVRVRVLTVQDDDGAEQLNLEGFYGYDPFHGQLYVVAVFAQGGTSFGAVGTFDRASHKRSTWGCICNATGGTTYVRDGFQLISDTRWRNRTMVRDGESGEWRQVYEGIYTRE
jgi:hypothetical protein